MLAHTNTRTVVFLGPSLPVEQARAVLPQATYLPPAQCGDVLRALRLAPTLIVLIDGLYEQVASVWHKEILLALSRGVRVVGGGSMGALRAAELAHLGMTGVGRSFRELRDGVLTDDDEVAVVHTLGGEPLTDAMVNVRDTVDAAVKRGVLNSSCAELVLQNAKSTFYAERTVEEAVQRTLKDVGDPAPLERFLTWTRAGGYRNRKAADAAATLRFAARLGDKRRRKITSPAAPLTGFLLGLLREVNCSAFSGFHAHLPPAETTALAARFLGNPYEETKRLARVLGAVHDIARGRGVATQKSQTLPGLGLLPAGGGSPRWLLSHDSSESAFLAFAQRMRTVVALEEEVCRERVAGEPLPSVDKYLQDLLRIDGAYAEHRRGGGSKAAASLREQEPARYRRLRLTARLWRVFEGAARDAGLEPRRDLLQELADDFRRQRGTESRLAMEAWLRAQDLDPDSFVDLLGAWYRFKMLIDNYNLGVLGVEPADDDVWWMRDALWLTGLYREAKGLLNPRRRERRDKVVLPADDEEAFRRDFRGGQLSVETERRWFEKLADGCTDGGQLTSHSRERRRVP